MAGLAMLTLAVLACGTARAEEEKILNIYNWSDYIADDTIKNFEKETGITVRYDNFDNNEILHAKLVAGKTGYDIVVPSSNWAKIQLEAGLFRKLDKSKLPNLVNLDPALQAQLATLDPKNEHLVPWAWGFTTLGINVDKVKKALGSMPMPDNSWDLLFDPKYASKLKSCGVSVLDAPSEMLPPALHYLGKPAYSKVAADYKEAGALLKKIRPYVTLFSSSSYINDMANGSICLVFGYSGDINIARQRAIDAKKGVNLQALIPKTGSTLFVDTMAIPKDAPHPENALKFINYAMRPEVAASLTNKLSYANPNLASLKFVKKEIANNKTVFLSSDDMKKMVAPDAVSNDIRRIITRTYTQFKAGR
ncbi:polyamine ABC transporter substrate-binding protein [Herminiimonas sp. CN]|uniref:polyamine ABC transporter substrate-binding protein n=1 Tax=Herminiimonas sp. CN TaxID=1349818 RepID=UPI0004732BD3|nr:polyamine ABC transporter substrate-binding protein [Herminiimonas sp. CN]